MVAFILQVARYAFKRPVMRSSVLFPHGRVHFSSGPFCVLPLIPRRKNYNKL